MEVVPFITGQWPDAKCTRFSQTHNVGIVKLLKKQKFCEINFCFIVFLRSPFWLRQVTGPGFFGVGFAGLSACAP
jgi:hypothetical protein